MSKLSVDLPAEKPPRMNERTWAVLTRRAQGKTLAEIGREFGVHRERVRQVQAEGEHFLSRPDAMLTHDQHEARWSPPWREIRDTFRGKSGPQTMAGSALIHGGYHTRAAVAAATDDELLRLRGLAKKGLAHTRAAIPHESM